MTKIRCRARRGADVDEGNDGDMQAVLFDLKNFGLMEEEDGLPERM
jgi:hypothetical protein